jgi:hypothetical protein
MLRCPSGFRPYLPWRHRVTERKLHAAWQEAVRAAATPIEYTATDENTPLWGPYLPSGVETSDGGKQE